MPNASEPKQAPPALVLTAFIASVFLSALLLFAVQPMFTRMVLPQLGGSPSVWSVAMVFFQSMLLAGYAYAHWLSLIRNRLMPVVVHLAVLAGAATMLPLAIAHGWGEPPGTFTEFWLLGLFTVSIGLPFFALAANNPLLQTWFVRTGHRDGTDPYFLYAASNVGSFLALLSYPVLMEPMFSLRVQGQLWSAGFIMLALLIAICGVLALRGPPDAASDTTQTSPVKPTWLALGRWTFLAAVPSGLLIAVTAHITTDVASAPLLWVMPLSLYLLTWILVFQRKPLFRHSFMLTLQPFAIGGIIFLLLNAGRIPVLPNLMAHLLAFFVIALACHGELARQRPQAADLTAFYVALSFGGMVGGLFAGLIAPYAFSWIAEYPILAALAVLCRPRVETEAPPLWARLVPPARWFWPGAAILALVLIVPAYRGLRIDTSDLDALRAVVLTLAVVSILFMRAPVQSAVAVALALTVIRLYPTDEGRGETLRSFFGVNQIYESPDRRYRILKHGSTYHGAQMIRNVDGTAVTGPPEPITYYHRTSPMAATVVAIRERKAASSPSPLRVAVIGLGTGSLACHAAKGEAWTFFEIDPTVIAIARDARRFNFISACLPDVPVVLGDARLTLAKQPDGLYDLIVVDAYSSDAIPVHLATAEAMAIYKSKLAPHGVVMMHISNRNLELQTVATGIAAANGLDSWVYTDPAQTEDDANFIFASDVVISALASTDIGALAWDKRWVPTAPDPAVRTWTDDYSNIAGAFWRKHYPDAEP
jgi:hypothetical protein